MRFRRHLLRSALLLAVVLVAGTSGAESPWLAPIDRAVIARSTDNGGVYVGWRLLVDDSPDVAFNVYRKTKGGKTEKVNKSPVAKTTDFVDDSAGADRAVAYFVRQLSGGSEGKASKEAAVDDAAKPYVTIPLDGKYTFQKVGIADLDGDRAYDFVIKQPNGNVDPYINYWKPSPETFKLEAYTAAGKMLWRHDLGWAIERGIWYSPYVVHDLDGDGCAEVAVKTGQGDPRDEDGRVREGPEYLTILDGRTGKPISQAPWISRDGFTGERGYNYWSRNQLCVAYLDGKHPHLIVERGTYNLMIAIAYRLIDGELREVWRWDNADLERTWWGQGAHWMRGADIDADGRDEVLLGSSVIDDDGTSLWTTGLGHPDYFYLGDLNPNHPGLEIFYGMETRQKERNGLCMVAAATGKIIWGHEGYTRHVHGQGMCSDIDPNHLGTECYGADTDSEKKFAWSRLYSSQGKLLDEDDLGGFSPKAVHWDADLQRELLRSKVISDYKGPAVGPRIDGHLAAVADILGDWREELITSVEGELRIYTTTLPARDRRVCLMQDPIYRSDVLAAAMGYFQVPLTSYDMASRAE